MFDLIGHFSTKSLIIGRFRYKIRRISTDWYEL